MLGYFTGSQPGCGRLHGARALVGVVHRNQRLALPKIGPMSKPLRPEAERRGWQVTNPSPLQDAPPPDEQQPGAPTAGGPPLTEVLRGLHSRELDTDSVFDQFFGPPQLPSV